MKKIILPILLLIFLCSCGNKAQEQMPTPVPTADALGNALSSMTLEEKVGQMFLLVRDTNDMSETVKDFNAGGVVLFEADFKGRTKDDVKAYTSALQSVSKIPLIIAVDEEGGDVVRISKFKGFAEAPFLSPRKLSEYIEDGNAIVAETEKKCILFQQLGINVNLAPVCDMTDNVDSYMYNRSYGNEVNMVSNFIDDTVLTSKAYNIGAVLKHFPGYGDNKDTHKGASVDEREESEFYNRDFVPFTAGLVYPNCAIMVSHNIVKCFDAENPASLSPEIHNIIRNRLGFIGVIMTDDLEMNAIDIPEEEAVVRAIKAGNDMVIVKGKNSYKEAVLDAVRNGEISEKDIDASAERILTWKTNLGLIK